jgi:hypothetical protein
LTAKRKGEDVKTPTPLDQIDAPPVDAEFGEWAGTAYHAYTVGQRWTLDDMEELSKALAAYIVTNREEIRKRLAESGYDDTYIYYLTGRI